jgi:hypothetical protein
MAAETVSLYAPWPMFTWMQTPLYKQAHASANQDGIFYCGRDIWPPDDWWQTNHAKLDLGYVYWVIESQRKGNKCVDCRTAWNHHLGRAVDPQRGYYQQPTVEDQTPVISLDALARLLESGVLS